MKTVLIVLGVILLLGAVTSHVHLTWVQHPEATDRLLWIEHTTRMILNAAASLAGFTCLGFAFKDDFK